jgi:DNA-binding SARP family transcriptional activator
VSRRNVFAKTARPSVTGVLPRQRLFEWLDGACTAPLVWVHGPAGAGKTSLVASYVEVRQRAALWYQVDSSDADPATFFAFLADAFAGGSELPMFTAEYRDEPRAFARHFFRALAAAHAGTLLLVLDNYQELDAQAPLHQLLLEGARELPTDFPLVMISREGPPAQFARSRANRELRLLSWPELRLNGEEIRAIAGRAGLSLDAAQLDTLHRCTQGWAAALILMIDGRSLTVNDTNPGWQQPPGLMFDYLAHEVFAALPAASRDVLLRTACVRELTAATAARLSEREDAGVTLHRLAEQHLLVSVKPGPHGAVYECHPLLREFLQRRSLLELSPVKRDELERDAAVALECEGSLDAAASLFAQHSQLLAGFIQRNAASMLSRGRADTLLAWIEQVPGAQRGALPWLAYWRGCCHAETDPGMAVASFSEAYEGFQRPGCEDCEGQALACARLMAAFIYTRHRFAVLDTWIPRALVLLHASQLNPGSEARQRLLVGLFMALVFRQPHHPAIGELAGECFEACQAIRDPATRTWSQLLIAINLNYTGQFERARVFIDGLKRGQAAIPESALSLTTLRTVESMFYMLSPDPQQCLRVVFDGIEAGRETGVRVWEYHLLVNGAAGALGAADMDTAGELLQRLEERAPTAGHLDRTIFHYLRSWLAMLAGDVNAAFREQRQAVQFAESAGCPLYLALCRLALAQVMLEQGDVRNAFRSMRTVRDLCAGVRNRLLLFTLNCVLADLAFRAGRRRLARSCLAAGLAIGREQGFSHCLWWLPEAMSRVCALAIEEGVETEYARTLVRLRGLEPPRRVLGREQWPWRYELYTLGRFRLRSHGEDSRRLSGRPLQLLKALVGLGGRDVSEESVAATLWPRIDMEYAQRSLATTLHRLRRSLGDDGVVVTHHGRLSLADTLCWVDLDEFLDLVHRIEEPTDAVHAGRDGVEAVAERLFQLYRGPFMAGEAAQGFSPLRERARNALLRALEVLTRRLQALGCDERIPNLYRQAQEVDPVAEAFYRRHMLCLRELGRNAQAVEVFGELRGMLAASAAGEPSAETRAIYEAVLRGL